jgi:hypothetical protein
LISSKFYSHHNTLPHGTKIVSGGRGSLENGCKEAVAAMFIWQDPEIRAGVQLNLLRLQD